MRKTFMSILVALALAVPANTVAAASKSPKLAKCKGKERRPANPYGTILPSVDPLARTSTPAEAAEAQEPDQSQKRKSVNVFPDPAPATPANSADKQVRQVPPISSASPQNFYWSC
tara:strand:+ start:5748 stop:6095 length:348 start_codon:yes stop_codon:yes gene_type:complete